MTKRRRKAVKQRGIVTLGEASACRRMPERKSVSCLEKGCRGFPHERLLLAQR
ncbi:hypothetical protein [Nostoc sp.]|uniref:hypothetical protein n=1 Tax=Nostoc sp. TaxID=1180 RepID=UPI002FF5B96F